MHMFRRMLLREKPFPVLLFDFVLTHKGFFVVVYLGFLLCCFVSQSLSICQIF